ncbi:hypothetical protein GGR57DRAFT_492870 [Xylariaceae sp. FL1272]|nr:hypothetical protein GGR57DRAFT_492870 [Xylariaceae sp. FL1272]
MAPPSYSAYGSGTGHQPTSYSSRYSSRSLDHSISIWDEIIVASRNFMRRLWAYGKGYGRLSAWSVTMNAGQQLRRNMVRRRLLSFPHLLAALWIVVLLWGERWLFVTKVQSCDWDHWEDWPAGATPHRLVFVADPQIIDPKSYPGRPWPINPLTMRITDNYMSKSYNQIQKTLRPDTVMFLGDLFDGGREWRTDHGNFDDPEWAKDHRPEEEKKLLKQWNKKYDERYWLKEYTRFIGMFSKTWGLGGALPGPFQRGRKLITSLPGNHDLGFGAEVKIPARDRFSAYFGETNRVDVIGNHTFVSVDTVSLSADSSHMMGQIELQDIYKPVNDFLSDVKAAKRRAVQKELRFWSGEVEEVVFEHKVEPLRDVDGSTNSPTLDLGPDSPDFPTILLTHVPLHRDPGTPCGPMREHWPPAKPPKGQTTPVIPDHRNAISVSSGYQYQNVLSETDSVKLIKSIGNVIHAFSGDDHDYCELVHSPEQESVREITVKSLSMAMGVPTPGFQMVSLYNPLGQDGKSLAKTPTLQTHLCLLPNQLSTFMTYAVLGVLSILLLVGRAFLVPVLQLQPFALDAVYAVPSAVLPVFKPKDDVDDASNFDINSSAAASASNLPSARMPSTRMRGGHSLVPQARHASPSPKGKRGPGGKWGWAQGKGPRIQIRRDDYYEKGDSWRPAVRPRGKMGVVATEIWTTTWRVVWMAVGFFAWLTFVG